MSIANSVKSEPIMYHNGLESESVSETESNSANDLESDLDSDSEIDYEEEISHYVMQIDNGNEEYSVQFNNIVKNYDLVKYKDYLDDNNVNKLNNILDDIKSRLKEVLKPSPLKNKLFQSPRYIHRLPQF